MIVMGMDNYQKMVAAVYSALGSGGNGFTGSRLNAFSVTDSIFKLFQNPPPTINCTKITDESVSIALSSIAAQQVHLRKAIQTTLPRMRAAVTNVSELLVDYGDINAYENPWILPSYSSNKYHENELARDKIFYANEDERDDGAFTSSYMGGTWPKDVRDARRTDQSVGTLKHSIMGPVYHRTCDNLHLVFLSILGLLSLVHEAEADDRLTPIILDQTTYNHLRKILYDMQLNHYICRHLFIIPELWHVLKSALTSLMKGPSSPLFLLSQLFLKYWMKSNFEITEQRMMMRHSSYNNMILMSQYFHAAWKLVKEYIYATYGEHIKKNKDLQMLVYMFNFCIPTILNFLGNTSKSPEIFLSALHDLIHVLSISATNYCPILLKYIADLFGLSVREEKIWIVFMMNIGKK